MRVTRQKKLFILDAIVKKLEDDADIWNFDFEKTDENVAAVKDIITKIEHESLYLRGYRKTWEAMVTFEDGKATVIKKRYKVPVKRETVVDDISKTSVTEKRIIEIVVI